MPRAKANGIELEYDTIGEAGRPVLVLVRGLGQQLVQWDDGFCQALAARGLLVVRYDNRDVGLSTKLDALGRPDMMRARTGDRSAARYGLEDMAADLAGLVDALGVARAHVVGVSMGGFIAQEAAIRHPERVLSLASIMSSTGNRSVGHPHAEAIPLLLAPPPRSREEALERAVVTWRAIGSPGFPFDEAGVRARAGRAWDRNHEHDGIARQLAAILTQRDRTADLAHVRAPTVVLHGAEDKLIDPSGGEATAQAIPGARFVRIAGMGHDLPAGAWPTIVDAVAENASRAAA